MSEERKDNALSIEAEEFLDRLVKRIRHGVQACMNQGAYAGAMVLICSGIECLSRFYSGSRSPLYKGSGRYFVRFVKRYLQGFSRYSKDDRGRDIRKSVQVSHKGRKAKKRMNYARLLYYLYRKGVIHEVCIKREKPVPQKELPPIYFQDDPIWGLIIDIELFCEDFLEAMERYRNDVLTEPLLKKRFEARFNQICVGIRPIGHPSGSAGESQ